MELPALIFWIVVVGIVSFVGLFLGLFLAEVVLEEVFRRQQARKQMVEFFLAALGGVVAVPWVLLYAPQSWGTVFGVTLGAASVLMVLLKKDRHAIVSLSVTLGLGFLVWVLFLGLGEARRRYGTVRDWLETSQRPAGVLMLLGMVGLLVVVYRAFEARHNHRLAERHELIGARYWKELEEEKWALEKRLVVIDDEQKRYAAEHMSRKGDKF